MTTAPGNAHDSDLLAPGLAALHRTGLQVQGSVLTLDAAFDDQDSRTQTRALGLEPVIHPNRRNTKQPIAVARLFRWFRHRLYEARFKVERTFAWEDTYRKLATTYDRLPETRLGFRYLAHTMVNFRATFSAGGAYSL